MKKINIRVVMLSFFIIAAFIVSACYKSKVPITSAVVPIDSRIIGTWYSSKYKRWRGKSTYYVISKLTVKKYKIGIYNWNYSKKKYKKPEIYHAHLSIVKGQKFLNMKKTTGYDKSYGINRLKVHSTKHIEIEPLSGNIKEQFRSSRKLKAFVKKYMHLSFFYEKSTRKLYK